MKYDRKRKITKEDEQMIIELKRWVSIVKENESKEEWYFFASLTELANRIEEYFLEIGYWKKSE